MEANKALSVENKKMMIETTELKSMISSQLHLMKNNNISLTLQLQEKEEKLRFFESIPRVDFESIHEGYSFFKI